MQRNLFIGYGFIGYGVFSLGACIPEPTIGSDTASMDRFTDIDGDGWTIEEGDCWEGSTQPTLVEGALSHSITSADIYPGVETFGMMASIPIVINRMILIKMGMALYRVNMKGLKHLVSLVQDC